MRGKGKKYLGKKIWAMKQRVKKITRLFYYAGNQPDPSIVTPDEMEEWYQIEEERRFKNNIK